MRNPIDDFSPEGTFMSEKDALDLIDQMKTKLGIQATMEEILVYEYGPNGFHDSLASLDYLISRRKTERRKTISDVTISNIKNEIKAIKTGLRELNGPELKEIRWSVEETEETEESKDYRLLAMISLIKKLLGLRESEEEIENRLEKDDSYRADTIARWESDLEKYIRRLQASERLHTEKEKEIRSWLDVIASMYDHLDKICVSESRCDLCHQPLIAFWLNPLREHGYSFGDAGEMEICPFCMRQVSFETRVHYDCTPPWL